MHEGHQGVFSLLLEGHGNRRLLSQRVRRRPGMLNSTRPLDLSKAAVMGRRLESPVEETVDFRI